MEWLRAALPEGRALPDGVWQRRHGLVRWLLWAHVIAIFGFALARGETPAHGANEAAIVVPFAVVAGWHRLSRTWQAGVASIGLLTCSAILVHLSGGMIEVHFHFFVMLGVIALYQDWMPYLLAVGFVALHHGTVGVLDPSGVYNHPAAVADPWTWALIHAGFILAASAASLGAWRLNEEYRRQADRARYQEAVAAVSREALTTTDFAELAEGAVQALAATLDVDYTAVRELHAEMGVLVMRAGAGWPKDAESAVAASAETHSGTALAAAGPVVVEDLARTDDFPGSVALRTHGVVSGASVVIPGPDGPYGVLGAYSRKKRSFDVHDLNFLQALANTLGSSLRQRRAEEQLVYQALHDPLTGLPNRTLFYDRLGHAVARACRTSDPTAVVLFDLDNFKAVNDSLGHLLGDRLLVATAERLSSVLRPGDTVARLGGDEFAVILEETVEVEALAIADRVLDGLRQPLVVGDRPFVVRASAGIATSREAADGEELVRNADLAMYAAKARGKGCIQAFHTDMHAAVARLYLEAAMREALACALEGNQFAIVYQPKVSLGAKRMTGVEALLRWNHPEHGLVSPAEFIPIAEETGLIVPIGAWVIHEACRQAAEWERLSPELASLVISVNVSRCQFDLDLVDTVRQALHDTGLDPAKLCLEITESTIMDDGDAAIDVLRRLKSAGVRISVDDFGTGYSSLSALTQFPLDELKVDKSFVDGLGAHEGDEAIVGAIIGMAHALGLSVVAEGIETETQLSLLRDLGCEEGQGFFFARPLAASDIALRAGGLDTRDAGRSALARDNASGRKAVLVGDDARTSAQ